MTRNIKRPKKRIVIMILVSAIVVVFLIYHESIIYGLGQLHGQVKILRNVRPISEVLADSTYSDSTKNSLKLIQEIRQYAEDSLGINHTDNYTTFYEQHRKPLLWNVTACEKYSLNPYNWNFPIVGSFSYKGFFDKQKADNELLSLKNKGYDTDLYAVSGWSTLGFLQDPILSQWLLYSEGKLANLIIHELTHSTLYVKNNVSYNENLASFVGDLGAKKFLVYKYGVNSKEFTHYLESQTDAETLRNFVLKYAQKLDSLYKSFPKNKAIAACEIEKQEFIKKFVQKLQDETFYNSNYCKYFDDEMPNNTFFMGFMRYYDQQYIFKEQFEKQFHSDFKLYMKYLKETYPHLL